MHVSPVRKEKEKKSVMEAVVLNDGAKKVVRIIYPKIVKDM